MDEVFRVFRKDSGSFELYILVPAAILLILTSGSGGSGSTFFGHPLQDYIVEETSLVTGLAQASSPVAGDIYSFTGPVYQIPGRGGNDMPLDPSFIQQNSILAYSPADDHYAEVITSQRNQITEYTVQEGDLISFIASDFGVSQSTIIWANNLKNPHALQVGQVLKIPPVSGVIHKIKKGDTVASLAKKYGAEEARIIEYNSLPQDGQLALDDEIIIPDGQPSASTTGAARVATVAAKPFSYLPDLGDYFMLPTNGFNWGRIHGRNGVDMANKCGTSIYAAADGVVTIADGVGWNGGFGQYIKISHENGTETLYAHARKLFVSTGENVSRGTLIAEMGTTGRSTGCHLHFEVHGARNPMIKY